MEDIKRPVTTAMFCQECGVQLRTAARFCNQCGSPVRQKFGSEASPEEPVNRESFAQAVPPAELDGKAETAEPRAGSRPASRSTLGTPADATDRHLHRPSAPLGSDEFSLSVSRTEAADFSEPAFFTTALPRTVNRRHNRLVMTTGLMLLAFIVLLVVFYFFAAKYA